MEALWETTVHWTVSLQRYILSIEVREETKLSLLLGLILGTVSVVIIAIYPGKPIDYSGAGFDLPSELRGSGDAPPSQNTPQNDEVLTRKGNSASGEGEASCQRPTEGTKSSLRRRRGKQSQETNSGQSEPTEDVSASSNAAEGGWGDDLDEDELTRKFANGKAVKLLGLTQDQVRQAVREAKHEMLRQDGAPQGDAGDHSLPRGGYMEGGIDLASAMSWAVAVSGLIGLWFFLYNNPRDPLTRFLIGAFPREMEVLGLSTGLRR